MLNTHENALKKHSKSFYLAGLLLPRATLLDVRRLYAYCRKMDDAVDEYNRPEDVLREKNALKDGQSEVQGLIQKHNIPPSVVDAFLATLIADVAPVNVKTEEELMAFCYGVAGTVGVMMCHVLGTKNPQALYHAIDLGIAMQLTNIARDRAEDEANNRHYFPQGLTQVDLVHMAESYYTSGINGTGFLPFAVRPSILAAALVYREIGQKILQNPDGAYTTRMVVPHHKKLICAFKGGLKAIAKRPPQVHDACLHQLILKFPCTHNGK